MTTMRKPPFLRTAFNYDTNAAGDESALHCEDESLTRQSFAEEVDINTIVNRFLKTGELPHVRAPIYADYDQVVDFKTAMDAVAQANEAFDALPAQVRARFHNNPQELLQFCADDGNREEAEKLGLTLARLPADEELYDKTTTHPLEDTQKKPSKETPKATTPPAEPKDTPKP